MTSRYELGMEMIKKLADDSGMKSMDELNKLSPRLAELAVEFGYADLYANPVLDLKQRAFITLSSLITQGDTEGELLFHFRAALNIGITKEEIVELITHLSGYAGFPRAINALMVFRKVLNDWEK